MNDPIDALTTEQLRAVDVGVIDRAILDAGDECDDLVRAGVRLLWELLPAGREREAQEASRELSARWGIRLAARVVRGEGMPVRCVQCKVPRVGQPDESCRRCLEFVHFAPGTVALCGRLPARGEAWKVTPLAPRATCPVCKTRIESDFGTEAAVVRKGV